MEEIYRRVFERPEFEGIHARTEAGHLPRAQMVAKARGRGRAPSIAERFRTEIARARLRLAASIVTADAKMPPSEIEFLKALQRQFGLSEEDVARLFELAEDRRRCHLPEGWR